MRIVRKIIFATGIAAMFASCKKQVDLQPTDVVPIENVFQNLNDINLGVNGVYGSWSARRSVYISSVISDEVRQGTGGEYRGVGAILYRWEHTSDAQDWRDGETGGVWTNMYTVIDRANRVLEFIDEIPTNNQSEVDLKARYKGELLALRAFAHFELLRNYAPFPFDAAAPGVVYQSEYVKNPGSYKPSRISSGEVMSKIEADLEQAKTMIPANFTDIGRVTRNAVFAMHARAALYARKWDVAATNATTVINVQPLTARANYAALWQTRTLPTNQSTEVIWKLNVTAANLGNAIGSLYQDANSALQLAPAQKLLNSYDQANDVRFSTFFRTAPRNLIAKYGVITALPTSENFQYDIKMLRTSEMYLIRAEARAELNDLIGAATDIFALRTQRITGAILPVYPTKQAAIDDIYLERYRELAYEGHRYYDLKRRGLPIVRDLSDVVGNTAIQTLQPSNPKYLLPIPQQEVFANPDIGQNPGY